MTVHLSVDIILSTTQMNEQVGGDLTKVDDSNNRYCSVEEMNKLCTRMV